jgi:tetratricopeptide (TPR) repeat protein
LGNQLPNFRVRAWAWIGNAHRLAYEFHDAESAFTIGEGEWNAILPKHRDELAVAELWHFKGVLRTFQHRFDEALDLANAAVPILETRSSSPEQLARALLSRGNILSYKEKNLAALEMLAKAAELVEEAGDPYLRLVIRTNTAGISAAAGFVGDSRRNLQKARPLCLQMGNRLGGFHLDWIEGILEEKEGHFENARERILQAREGFGQLDELGYFSAASLDLALLCLKQGEIARPFVLAAEVATVFESLKFHPELLTAVRLLRNALATQCISRDVLQQVRDLLKRLQPLDFRNLKNSR